MPAWYRGLLSNGTQHISGHFTLSIRILTDVPLLYSDFTWEAFCEDHSFLRRYFPMVTYASK